MVHDIFMYIYDLFMYMYMYMYKYIDYGTLFTILYKEYYPQQNTMQHSMLYTYVITVATKRP